MKIRGIARIDLRTKRLARRLRRGEIALIDHQDLDSVAAESLVRAGASAVVNAAQSISGRYPNLGPSLLIDHEIPLLDHVGPELMKAFREGMTVEIDTDQGTLSPVSSASSSLPTLLRGNLLTRESVREALEISRKNLRLELRQFAENTLRYVQNEDHLLLDALDLPELEVSLVDRHALVVVRGENYEKDLHAIRSYIRNRHPVVLGVDGGADALLEIGIQPDIIIGDMDSVSDRALRSGAELIVHAYPDRDAPGFPRLEKMGLTCKIFRAPGTSEDIALLLAHEKGAELIVAIGTHFGLIDFLEKGRAGMASTFLTRLKLGGRLVDARGVSKLHDTVLKPSHVLLLMLAGGLSVGLVMISSEAVQHYLSLGGLYLNLAVHWLRGIL